MLTKEEAIDLYRKMLLIRRFEQRCAQLYTQGKIGGYLHLYIGQEAVATGFISCLQPGDYVLDAYRDHAHAILMGLDPKVIMAELMGKITGCSKGKGGSMHLFSRETGFLGGTGIVGAGIPLGTGVGFAIKYRGEKRVCLCFFGDGAVNEGAFHESLNLASLWNLPVVYICENNLYGMGTHVSRASAIPELVERAAGYGIERERIDGMDLLKVRECAERVISQVRETSRPYFIEVVTYRYVGHGAADPGTYRTREEVEAWRQRDCLLQFERYLKEQNYLDDEGMQRLQREVREEVEEAIRFAEQSPAPSPEELYTDLYV